LLGVFGRAAGTFELFAGAGAATPAVLFWPKQGVIMMKPATKKTGRFRSRVVCIWQPICMFLCQTFHGRRGSACTGSVLETVTGLEDGIEPVALQHETPG
jgi:hypothetical protein